MNFTFSLKLWYYLDMREVFNKGHKWMLITAVSLCMVGLFVLIVACPRLLIPVSDNDEVITEIPKCESPLKKPKKKPQ